MSLTTTDRPEIVASPVHVQHMDADPISVDQDAITGSDSAPTRPTFTITDAATACSVSRKTITRKLPELAGHGAAKDDDGVWRIPVEALLAVGLHPGRSLPQAASAPMRPAPLAPSPTRHVDQDTVTIPRDRWDDVRIRLARAEAEAAERGLALADARLALRALTAGPMSAQAEPRSTQAVTQAPITFPDAGAHHAPSPSQVTPGASQLSPGMIAVPGPAGGDSPAAAPRAAAAAVVDAPEAEGIGSPSTIAAGPAPGDVIAARNLAARTGGYVPAVAAPGKKRRWWQSR